MFHNFEEMFWATPVAAGTRWSDSCLGLKMISTFWGAHELYKGLRFQMGPALASSKKNWRSWSKITQALTRPLDLLWIVPSGTSAVLSTTIAFHTKIICNMTEVMRRWCISRRLQGWKNITGDGTRIHDLPILFNLFTFHDVVTPGVNVFSDDSEIFFIQLQFIKYWWRFHFQLIILSALNLDTEVASCELWRPNKSSVNYWSISKARYKELWLHVYFMYYYLWLYQRK